MDYQELSTRYTGQVASAYEAKRSVTRNWPKEQAAVERFLAKIPAGSTILDVPVGTGRFISFYKQFGLVATGLDTSLDMLEHSQRKAADCNLDIALHVGDIRNIQAEAKSFDTALCVRFLNWLDFQGMQEVLGELSRVARSHIIISVRVWPTPRTFISRVAQGWTSFRRRHAQLRFHNTEDTEAIFSKIGFQIEHKEIVERDRNQTQFVFYLLARSACS
jgi:ubiquinone/menaquinone biosynthesis C-methylase UbiE